MNDDLSNYSYEEIEKATEKILTKPETFEKSEVNEKLIVNIIYQKIIHKGYKKWFIEIIVSLIIKIFCEAMKQNIKIKLTNLGEFCSEENEGRKVIIFKPNNNLVKYINYDIREAKKFLIFKVIKYEKDYFILSPDKSNIDNNDYYYRKNMLPKCEKLKINKNYDNLNVKIISLTTLNNLIISKY